MAATNRAEVNINAFNLISYDKPLPLLINTFSIQAHREKSLQPFDFLKCFIWSMPQSILLGRTSIHVPNFYPKVVFGQNQFRDFSLGYHSYFTGISQRV